MNSSAELFHVHLSMDEPVRVKKSMNRFNVYQTAQSYFLPLVDSVSSKVANNEYFGNKTVINFWTLF